MFKNLARHWTALICFPAILVGCGTILSDITPHDPIMLVLVLAIVAYGVVPGAIALLSARTDAARADEDFGSSSNDTIPESDDNAAHVHRHRLPNLPAARARRAIRDRTIAGHIHRTQGTQGAEAGGRSQRRAQQNRPHRK
jgi:hypothetical protein